MSSTSTPTPRARRRTKIALVVLAALGVALTPLAVNAIFTGALSNVDTNLQQVPAAVVNNDQMTTSTAADGTKTTNFAGRGLVTQLTGPGSNGFAWTATNSDDAAAGLADGRYYAVLTIPSDFSASLDTLASTTPTQGLLDIKTDASHGYLSGLVASTVASSVQAGFGQQVTAQVVNGIYTSFGGVGKSLSDASGGATQLATGADGLASGASQLASGLDQLGSGAATAASGASKLSDGVAAYTNGVTGLAGGLDQLRTGTSGLGGLNELYSNYSGNVSAANASLNTALAQLATDPAAAQQSLAAAAKSLGTAQYIADNFPLGSSIAGLGQLESGIADAANGADQLAANGPDLASGASGLASGVSQLATGVQQTVPGAQQLATGATQLGVGARTLASGLQSGADQLQANSGGDTSAAAKVVAQPVKVDVTTVNAVSGVGQIVTTVLLPVALWLGALAVFLWLRPFSRAVLASSATTGRLTLRTFGRAAAVVGVQVVLLVAFLHLVLGVAWSSLPATLGFSLLVAFAFTAFHQLLATAFGRVGAVVSLVLLALQLAATGGLYPVEILSGPFQFINSISPMAYAVTGIQNILTGGAAGPVWTAAVFLAVMLLVSILLAGVALARRRRPVEIGWALPRKAGTRIRPALALPRAGSGAGPAALPSTGPGSSPSPA
ncbi:YhgE/Pip family protein [Herbiconiux sp. 11R-BC]|uniref:YhgE/Pip family protein n=1 Tax=Herbiconiux sp. 11R-BC TaxID=3111637 RepID=UPI003C05EA77